MWGTLIYQHKLFFCFQHFCFSPFLLSDSFSNLHFTVPNFLAIYFDFSISSSSLFSFCHLIEFLLFFILFLKVFPSPPPTLFRFDPVNCLLSQNDFIICSQRRNKKNNEFGQLLIFPLIPDHLSPSCPLSWFLVPFTIAPGSLLFLSHQW